MHVTPHKTIRRCVRVIIIIIKKTNKNNNNNDNDYRMINYSVCIVLFS